MSISIPLLMFPKFSSAPFDEFQFFSRAILLLIPGIIVQLVSRHRHLPSMLAHLVTTVHVARLAQCHVRTVPIKILLLKKVVYSVLKDIIATQLKVTWYLPSYAQPVTIVHRKLHTDSRFHVKREHTAHNKGTQWKVSVCYVHQGTIALRTDWTL